MTAPFWLIAAFIAGMFAGGWIMDEIRSNKEK